MTEQIVGKVMLTFKGNYDATKQYDFLDTVTYNGSSFVCLADGTKNAPSGVSENWQLLSQKGQDGQPGKDGKDGVSPDTSTFALKSELPDLSGYAKKSDIPVEPDLSQYALKSEIPKIPDLSKYALKTEIPSVPDLSKYALKSDIPSSVDLSGYAKKTDIPDVSILATKTEVQSAQTTANTANKAARDDATLIKQLSKRVDGIKAPDLTNYATKDQVAQTNQVKTITSGLLTDLAKDNGVYHYEIDFFPDDRPTLTYGLLDVVVGTHYAKQTFTDDSGNVYVRMRGWDGNWSDWRQITQWN